MKYSITIPAYKAKFLGRCIDSILAQTFKDFELIIVNDASPEDLGSIVNLYNDDRIKYYINEVNCGAVDVVDNWNICLSYASGDYIICIGDDDELSSDCLEQYNLLMTEYPDLDIYHGRVMVIDEDSNFVNLSFATPPYESVYSLIWHRLNGRLQFIGDFLYKISTLRVNGGFYKIPLAWGSDCVSAYMAAINSGIANTVTPIFYYRSNGRSISSSGDATIKLQALEYHKKWILTFLEKSKPSIEIDSFYHKMISKQLDRYFKKRCVSEIAKDMAGYNFFRFFHWLIHHRKLKLSVSDLLYAYAKSIKIKKILK